MTRLLLVVFLMLASGIAYSDTIVQSTTAVVNGVASIVTTTIVITPISQRITNTGDFRVTNTGDNRTVSP